MLEIVLEVKAEAEREKLFAEAKLSAINSILAKIEAEKMILEAVESTEIEDISDDDTASSTEFGIE